MKVVRKTKSKKVKKALTKKPLVKNTNTVKEKFIKISLESVLEIAKLTIDTQAGVIKKLIRENDLLKSKLKKK